MLKKDRERSADFAWTVLEQAPYAVLAMSDGAQPYCIPVTPGACREKGVVYIHCARVGKKREVLAKNARVCLTAVSRAASVEREFTMAFDSAVATGVVEEVEDREEKVAAMRILCERYDPKGMDLFDDVISRCLGGTCVLRIRVEEITGKQAYAGE